MDDAASKERLAVFTTSQGLEIRATIAHLTRYAATLEIYSSDAIVRTSQLLDEFKIFSHDAILYAGRCVVRETISTGTVTVCSVLLDDSGFNPDFFVDLALPGRLSERFRDFVRDWEVVCRVLPEFKVAVADIQTFLIDLRQWLEQLELGIRASPKPDRLEQERHVINELIPRINPIIDTLFEKFETIALGFDQHQASIHRSYIQRHLHPIVLSAPFAYRSYHKPLGYAGDYEIINMMVRDPQEGSSLFAKIFNVWLLCQGTAVAHRNRIGYLQRRLIEQTAAALRVGRRARILNLGCGPAWEIQEFLANSELSSSADFTLMDFNEETLQHAAHVLDQKQKQFNRSASIDLMKKSVQNLLKDVAAGNAISKAGNFDFIYCAGLFDYLPDRTCRRLSNLFYRSLAPGGLLLFTNVTPSAPNRGSLELILDWHLNYRAVPQVAALGPEGVSEDQLRIESDDTGFNLFLEARKNNGS